MSTTKLETPSPWFLGLDPAPVLPADSDNDTATEHREPPTLLPLFFLLLVTVNQETTISLQFQSDSNFRKETISILDPTNQTTSIKKPVFKRFPALRLLQTSNS